VTGSNEEDPTDYNNSLINPNMKGKKFTKLALDQEEEKRLKEE